MRRSILINSPKSRSHRTEATPNCLLVCAGARAVQEAQVPLYVAKYFGQPAKRAAEALITNNYGMDKRRIYRISITYNLSNKRRARFAPRVY